MSSTPYHSTRDAGSQRPRLLLVSFHFPPRESAGALRWRKMSQHLHSAGWDLDVLTTPPPRRPDRDGGLSDLPPGVELYAVPDGPGRLRRLEEGVADWLRRRRTRGNGGPPVALPGGESSEERRMMPYSELSWTPKSLRDLVRVYHTLLHHEETISWARAATRVGQDLFRRARYRGVLASAPPWGTLIAGGSLAVSGGIPLVLDFRDPWSLPRPFLTESDAHPLSFALARLYEGKAVRASSAVIMNTPTASRAMTETYPGKRIVTILNGVDEVFHDVGPRAEDTFRILYAGSIYIDRDPRVLFKAVNTVVREMNLTATDLQLEFIGEASHVLGKPTEELAREAGIEEYFRLRPPMPRQELLEHLMRAAVLVSLPQSTPWSMPSKIYEYMGLSARLLVYAEKGSATAEVLADSNAIVLEAKDLEGTVQALRDCYRQHRAGDLSHRGRNGDRFARSRRGEELLTLLREIGLVADNVAI